MRKNLLFTLLLPIWLCFTVSAQNVGIGTTTPVNNLHINGVPLPNLQGNANAMIAFGVPQFPGCLGRMGRFCRLDPQTLLPDGRYDLIRYLNAQYNPAAGQFLQIDPDFDVWIDGPCIANDPALTGFDIAYCPAGQTGPITPLTRLRINNLGNMGIGTPNPLGNLHVNGIPLPLLNDNANATMLFGPPGFPGCLGRMGRFCRLDPITLLPDGRYDLIRYMNARYNLAIGGFEQVDADFDVWMDGPCIANDPNLTGFDIAYCPAGQTGPITPLTRLRINDLGNVGLGTPTPLGNLHVNGIPQTILGGNANPTMLFGPPNFPGCLGRMGRFCRLDPVTLLPDGRYDLIRYLNARYNLAIGGFEQVDANFDVWIDGPCIANDPDLTGFDIAYCPAGQTGPITPLTRLRINDVGNVGLGTPNPLGNLHINGIPQTLLNNNANARIFFGPPNFPGCLGRMGRFCRLGPNGLPDGRYDLIRYLNAQFIPATGAFERVDEKFDVWMEGPCIAHVDSAGAVTGYDISYAPAGPPGTINPQSRMRIDGLGNMGIGTPTPDPGFRLQVEGTVAAVEFVQLSDEQLKKNITDLTGSLDKVMQLRGVSFEFDPDANTANIPEGTCLGFIAQEVQEVLPELVYEKNDGYLTMNYVSVIPVLTEAITEQQGNIEFLEKRIEAQDKEISKLRAMLMSKAEEEQGYDKLADQNVLMQAEIDMLKAAILGDPEK